MATSKRVSQPRKTPATRAARKATTVAEREGVKQQLAEVLQKAKDSSREVLLAGIGAVAAAKEAQDERRAEFAERKASLIAAGRKLEPKVTKAVEEFKARVQEAGTVDTSKVKEAFESLKARVEDATKIKFEGKKAAKVDRKELGKKFDAGLERVWSGLGIPTRADLDKLNQKVDKLIALQRV